ncbi:ArsR family transcriptional regulator [Thiohalorhabdus denitrificans]|uniref:Transcriptional regulator, ArsR family n=1 Tax=Thiohalorhabdus denitrificans TaxID=381306 RepID=A0A0N8PMT5_9GAMM|nr:metalloregulator ArsR/SmtB family transcription factor [Thiohalorhabdus denitrificans]KPV39621.1 ArsR family transcriptional regulator [Thiohalorhabdus denitrificans]SCX96512.1 transcriptional regulator, ArsR family [Thiohalorhabdus denitrificans]
MACQAEEFFRALGDETRLRCVALLQAEGELCVCELTHALGLAQPKVSRHLAQLRNAGVVASHRRGTWMHYMLHPELPDWARRVVAEWAAACADRAPFAEDRRALQAMPDRPEKACCA